MSVTLTIQFDSANLQLLCSVLCALFSGGNFFFAYQKQRDKQK